MTSRPQHRMKEKEKKIIYGPIISNMLLMNPMCMFLFVHMIVGAAGFITKKTRKPDDTWVPEGNPQQTDYETTTIAHIGDTENC